MECFINRPWISRSANWKRRPRRGRSNCGIDAPRLLGESLEDRCVLATFTVSSTDDSLNPGTLRHAVQEANALAGPDAIEFDFHGPREINLTLGEMELRGALTIRAQADRPVTIDAQDASRIFNIVVTPGSYVFDGLHLTRGATNGFVNDSGGAVRSLTDGSVTFRNGRLTDSITNSFGGHGGAVYALGSVTLSNMVVSGNQTRQNNSMGGAVFTRGNLSADGSTVSGNSTLGGQTANGGGLAADGNVTLQYSTVSGNTTAGASSQGGGIWSHAQVTVRNSTVNGNSTSGTYGYGGGIFAQDALVVVNSTISGNSTTGQGARGGGAWTAGPVGVNHSTVTQNSTAGSGAQGGGVFQYPTPNAAPVTITHSILSGNTSSSGSPDLSRDLFSPTNITYCVIGTGVTWTTSQGNFRINNPQVGALANNGGLTLTHAPLANSPAVNAGTPNFGNTPVNDQRGAPFVRVSGGRIDIGAVERQSAPFTIRVTTNADELDYTNADVSLREAIAWANGNPGADTVVFGLSVASSEIDLVMGELQITDGIRIDGGPVPSVTIDAQQISRIFNIDDAETENENFDVTLRGLTISGGLTIADREGGGGIRSATDGELAIESLEIINNRTSGERSGGGGVFSRGDLTIANSTVSGNSTAGVGAYGGGVYADRVLITDSTVSGNSTTGFVAGGGGVWTYEDLTITNSTISGNSTGGFGAHGGGIRSRGDVIVDNSTIVNNRVMRDAAARGAGIMLSSFSERDIRLMLRNTVVATPGPDSDEPDIAVDVSGGGSVISSIQFSLIGNAGQSNFPGATNIIGRPGNPIDPLLGLLADHGGTTMTHAVLPGSPLFNAGDPGFTALPFLDQRDSARVAFGHVDIGAFELSLAELTPLPSQLVVSKVADEVDLDFGPDELSLREAVFFANELRPGHDEITFDESVFAPGRIALEHGQLQITDAVTVDGGERVTIDAQRNSRVFNVDNPATENESFDVGFHGLTITNGLTTDDDEPGGAVNSKTDGELTIRDSNVINNSTAGRGSAGGGISALGSLTVTNSRVEGNSTTGTDSNGGGILALGTLTLTNTGVTRNRTTGRASQGGGIYSVRGDLTLLESTVSGNNTAGDRAYGGGIVAARNLTLTNSTVSGNSTTGREATGGGVFAYRDATLTNSTISGNTTSGNDAHGGGIYSRAMISRNVTATNSTIVDNRALGEGARGSGILIKSHAGQDSRLMLHNTVVAAPGGESDQPDIVIDESDGGSIIATINYSFVGNGDNISYSGAGNIVGSSEVPRDPFLGPLADNGGPTMTHTIVPASPLFNAGDPAFVGPPNLDQRGVSDRVDFGRVDIGAYELSLADLTPLPSRLVVSSVGDEVDLNFGPGELSLREAVFFANYTRPGHDEITFDTTVFSTPRRIELEHGQLRATESLTITGPGPDLLTIHGRQQSRLLEFSNPTLATLNGQITGVTLMGGRVRARSYETGGAVRFLSDGLLTIRESVISGNTTTGDDAHGGGVFAWGQVVINDSVFTGNNANGAYTNGGGIYSLGAIDVTGSTISGNTARSGGGGLFSMYGSVTVRESTIDGNTAGGAGVVEAFGGGINAPVVQVLQSTVSRNRALAGNSSYGGGIFGSPSRGLTSMLETSVHVVDSTISNNLASAEVVAPLFTYGGGIFVGGDSLDLRRTTVAQNQVTGRAVAAQGSGIHVGNNVFASIRNSIVADNSSVLDAGDIAASPLGATWTIDYSLVGDTTRSGITAADGTGNVLDQDARLGPLANNGGPTATHALLPISPAVNTGSVSIAVPPEFDQRGEPFERVRGGQIDMGAYELQREATPGDFDGDNQVSADDIDLLCQELSHGNSSTRFDLSGDGVVDQRDIDFLVRNILQTEYGDANLDGRVDSADLNELALHWRQSSRASWSSGDFNCDGGVDAKDLNQLALHWQRRSAQPVRGLVAKHPAKIVAQLTTPSAGRRWFGRPDQDADSVATVVRGPAAFGRQSSC